MWKCATGRIGYPFHPFHKTRPELGQSLPEIKRLKTRGFVALVHREVGQEREWCRLRRESQDGQVKPEGNGNLNCAGTASEALTHRGELTSSPDEMSGIFRLGKPPTGLVYGTGREYI